MSMTTTGYAALAAGESWHYVGETDQPAFEGAWGNSSGSPAMAFRIRESGVVDLAGSITGATTASIFYLPEGYRPNVKTPGVVVYDTVNGAVSMQVDTDGLVKFNGGSLSGSVVNIQTQFFLDMPVNAP